MEEVNKIIEKYKKFGSPTVAITDVAEIIRLMQKDKEEQLSIQRVSFCLPVENETFEQWFNKHFNHLGNTMVECKNQATIKYNESEILELYSFLTDRLLAN